MKKTTVQSNINLETLAGGETLLQRRGAGLKSMVVERGILLLKSQHLI